MQRLLTLCISVLFVFPTQAQELTETADDLFQQLEEVRRSGSHDSVEIQLMLSLAHHYIYINPDSSIMLSHQVRKTAMANMALDDVGKAWNFIGIAQTNLGKLENALKSYDSSLYYYQQTENLSGKAKVWVNQGRVWRKQTNYGQALEAYVKAMKVFEDNQDTLNLGHTYNNMASVYGKQGNFEAALRLYLKSGELQKAAANRVGQARALSNVAITYYKKGDWEMAENYALQTLAIHEDMGDLSEQALTFNMLGVITEESGDVSKALRYYEKALQLNKELGTQSQIVSVQDNLAALYASQNQIDKSIELYEANLELAAEIGLPEMLMETNQDLSKLYEREGQTALALHHYKAYNSWKDTVFNVEKQKLEEDAMEKFETIQKEQEIKALKKDGIIDGLLLNSKDDSITIRNTFLVIGGLGLVIALILGFNFLTRARAQRQLRVKDQELNKRRMTEVMDTNEKKVLQAYLEGEDQERKRIAEDLHDRIGSNLLTVKLYVDKLNEDLAEADSSDLKQNLNKVGEVVNGTIGEVRHVAHNLASGAISKFGLIAALEDLSATIKGAGQVDVILDVFDVTDEIPRSIELQLFLVLRELVANALKHANAELITISLSREGEQLNVLLSDDGKGFNWSEKKSTAGIGLQNCFARVDKLGGQMTVDSQPGHGTTIIFDVRLHDTLTENID